MCSVYGVCEMLCGVVCLRSCVWCVFCVLGGVWCGVC